MEPQPKGNSLYDTVLPQVELINWLVLGAGLLLSCLLLVTGGNMLILVGLEGLAIIYFLRAFEPSKQEITVELNLDSPISKPLTSEVFITVLSRQMVAFGSAIIFLGIAFKIRFWEGAAIMLPVGIGLLLVAIAWQSSVGILTRQTVLIAGLGLFAWTFPTDTLVQLLFRDDPTLVKKLLFQQQHPQDQAAAKEAKQLIGLWHKRKY
jgi:hypothetical protein